MNIIGNEFHSIIENIFGDVKGIGYSNQLQVNCPKCQERDGLSQPDGKYNLDINCEKRVFRCWKCDDPTFSGSLGRLIRTFGSVADYELYRSYAGVYSDFEYEEEEVIVKLPKEMILFSDMDVNNIEHFEAYNYMVVDRKINRDLLLKYKIGFCIDGKYTKRIVIPSYDKFGNLNYFITRTYDESIKKKKYDNPKANKDSIIFNEGFINWDFTVYLVEGAFDMLSMPNNTIPMLGKTISNTLFIKLKQLKPNIVIVLDPDALKESIDLLILLNNIYFGFEERLRVVVIPTDEDIDEYRKNRGTKEVAKLLRTAREICIDDYFIRELKGGNSW